MNLLTVFNPDMFVVGSAGLIDYFIDSNNAGKVVICLLMVMNCYALSLMFSKHNLFKKVNAKNARDEKRINDLSNIFDYDDAHLNEVIDEVEISNEEDNDISSTSDNDEYSDISDENNSKNL